MKKQYYWQKELIKLLCQQRSMDHETTSKTKTTEIKISIKIKTETLTEINKTIPNTRNIHQTRTTETSNTGQTTIIIVVNKIKLNLIMFPNSTITIIKALHRWC